MIRQQLRGDPIGVPLINHLHVERFLRRVIALPEFLEGLWRWAAEWGKRFTCENLHRAQAGQNRCDQLLLLGNGVNHVTSSHSTGAP